MRRRELTFGTMSLSKHPLTDLRMSCGGFKESRHRRALVLSSRKNETVVKHGIPTPG